MEGKTARQEGGTRGRGKHAISWTMRQCDETRRCCPPGIFSLLASSVCHLSRRCPILLAASNLVNGQIGLVGGWPSHLCEAGLSQVLTAAHHASDWFSMRNSSHRATSFLWPTASASDTPAPASLPFCSPMECQPFATAALLSDVFMLCGSASCPALDSSSNNDEELCRSHGAVQLLLALQISRCNTVLL
jgi:hypothetical protein